MVLTAPSWLSSSSITSHPTKTGICGHVGNLRSYACEQTKYLLAYLTHHIDGHKLISIHEELSEQLNDLRVLIVAKKKITFARLLYCFYNINISMIRPGSIIGLSGICTYVLRRI